MAQRQMRKIIQEKLLITLGWIFVILGALGVVLPVLPTTPFLILALALFSKSSPKFHRMLLENRWFGDGLRQWEEQKTLSRKTKRTAYISIVLTFTLSIAILRDRPEVQVLLIGIGIVLLYYIRRLPVELKEPDNYSGG